MFQVSDEKKFASLSHRYTPRAVNQSMSTNFTVKLFTSEKTKDGTASPVTVIGKIFFK